MEQRIIKQATGLPGLFTRECVFWSLPLFKVGIPVSLEVKWSPQGGNPGDPRGEWDGKCDVWMDARIGQVAMCGEGFE